MPLTQFADQPLERGDPSLILLEQIGGGGVLVEFAGFILSNPDPDQIPADVVPLRQSVKRLAAEMLLRDLTFELDVVDPMLGHGLSFLESPAYRSIVKLTPVRPQGPTPDKGQSSMPTDRRKSGKR